MSKNISRTPRADPSKPTGKPPVEMFESPPRLSTRGQKQPSMSDVMKAISTLTSRIDTMEHRLSEQVRSDISSLMAGVEDRVVARCEATASEAIQSYHTEVTSKLEAKLNRLVEEKESDEAKLTAILHGVPETTERKTVDALLKKVDNNFRSFRLFTNPKTSKTTGVLSFGTTQLRDNFVTKFRSQERTIVDGGMNHVLSLVSGKTKLQRERNSAIRSKMDDLVKMASPDQSWSVDWMKRSILLNGKVKYRQQRSSAEIVEVVKQVK